MPMYYHVIYGLIKLFESESESESDAAYTGGNTQDKTRQDDIS